MRRALIRVIIDQKMILQTIDSYLEQEAYNLIPKEYRVAFVEDVKEDLHLLDEGRLAGLGITTQQFQVWNQLKPLG